MTEYHAALYGGIIVCGVIYVIWLQRWTKKKREAEGGLAEHEVYGFACYDVGLEKKSEKTHE